jgi:hypothetical protein
MDSWSEILKFYAGSAALAFVFMSSTGGQIIGCTLAAIGIAGYWVWRK